MSNPIDKYLQDKTASQMKLPGMGGVGRAVGGFARSAAQSAAREAPKALGGAAAGLGVAAVGAAVSKIHDALTKRRDFRMMLEHNPHLAEQHAQDPKSFNQMYSTLRTFNPDFAADPLVAGTYMDRMFQNPGQAGGIATDALNARRNMPNPMSDSFHAGALKGIGGR